MESKRWRIGRQNALTLALLLGAIGHFWILSIHYGSTPRDLEEWSHPSAKVAPRIAHVWAPYIPQQYKSPQDQQLFAPLDQRQNITWASLWTARERYRQVFGENVDVICAILWTDVDNLTAHQPPLCPPDHTVVLNRSSHTEYPDLQPAIHFPFVQDILQAPNSWNYDYLVFTNADITLTQDFYIHVRNIIVDHGYDAFRFNRRTIWKTKKGEEEISSHHLQWVEKKLLPDGEWHHGTDCFIMRRDVVQSVDLGNMYIGNPPWAGALNRYLMVGGTQNYKSFGSEFGWTYHIADDQAWRKRPKVRRGTSQEQRQIKRAFVDCPVVGSPNNALLKPVHWQTAAEGLKLSLLSSNEKNLLKLYYSAGEASRVEYERALLQGGYHFNQNHSWKDIAHLLPPA